MLNLYYIVIVLVAGILLGFIFRNKKKLNIDKLTLATILVLISSLGFSIGSNNALLDSLPRVGGEALVIVSLVLLFSTVFVLLGKKAVRLD